MTEQGKVDMIVFWVCIFGAIIIGVFKLLL